MTGGSVPSKYTYQPGLLNALEIEIFVGDGTSVNEDIFSIDNGIIIFINNQSVS